MIKMERTCIIRESLFVVLLFGAQMLNAQNAMRIHYKDGTRVYMPIEQIDSITFLDGEEVPLMGELKGSWLWGNAEVGYYEMLTFNEDHTYTGYDNYFTYGFDTMTYGWWGQMGAMLTLQSNGFGYQRRYNWYITGLSTNALSVMTKMGPFTYYRLQPEIYSIKVGEESYECKDGDYYVFTDGAKVTVSSGKLKGLSEGTTYILKYSEKSDLIMAYKVNVENS